MGIVITMIVLVVICVIISLLVTLYREEKISKRDYKKDLKMDYKKDLKMNIFWAYDWASSGVAPFEFAGKYSHGYIIYYLGATPYVAANIQLTWAHGPYGDILPLLIRKATKKDIWIYDFLCGMGLE